MSERALARQNGANHLEQVDYSVLEHVVANGDLSKLKPAERLSYYRMRCEAAGLDPRTQPFQYITLQGKLTLYATKAATDQLCRVHGITLEIVGRERLDDIYVVTCRATARDGRHTEDIGAVTIGNAKGDQLCNALMKATTKAKRRTVLSLCGLGMMDETETETVSGAQPVRVDLETGEVLEGASAPVTTQVVELPRRDQQPQPETQAAGDLDRKRKIFFAEFGSHFGNVSREQRHEILNALLRPRKPITTCSDWTERHYERAMTALEGHVEECPGGAACPLRPVTAESTADLFDGEVIEGEVVDEQSTLGYGKL